MHPAWVTALPSLITPRDDCFHTFSPPRLWAPGGQGQTALPGPPQHKAWHRINSVEWYGSESGLLKGLHPEVTHVTSTHIPWPKASYTLLAALSTPQALPGRIQLCQTDLHRDCQMDQCQTGGEWPNQVNISTPWEPPSQKGHFRKCGKVANEVGMKGRILDTDGGAYTRAYSYPAVNSLYDLGHSPFPQRSSSSPSV